ncbi:MAG: FkbM family methyltransferase [Verrucomicrobia subdivision 3 bacterium]|nr:FkbM family methyltransferase [Limisphaerales bacterium]
MFKKIAKYIWSLRKAYLTNFRQTHYAQFGEDIVLDELLKPELCDGFYVDVGCYHPKKHSNTYRLHQRGWNGINIDLEEDKIRLFNLCRPNDHNVVCPVSDLEETVTIRRFSSFGLGTTINSQQAAGTNEAVFDERQAKTKTLAQIIEESPFAGRKIDLLSIEAEGMDERILKSVDFDRHFPKIILIEDYHRNIGEIIGTDSYKLLTSKGYALRSWTFYTLIFVQPETDILMPRENK